MFGSIVLIPTTTRLGVVSGQMLFDLNKKYTQIYPISSAIYLAGADDFICKIVSSKNEIMIECWNSILLPKQELEIVDNISNEYITVYSSYLKLRACNRRMQHKALFTGPPIVSQIDIRRSFRKIEYATFNAVRNDLLIDTLDSRWLHDFSNKEAI